MSRKMRVTPADPFDLGTGRIDLLTATQAGLLLHETKINYENADPKIGGDPTTLNLASMGDGDCYQTCAGHEPFAILLVQR